MGTPYLPRGGLVGVRCPGPYVLDNARNTLVIAETSRSSLAPRASATVLEIPSAGELEPVARASLYVRAIGPLGDHALPTFGAGLPKVVPACGHAVGWESERTAEGDGLAQQRLAVA